MRRFPLSSDELELLLEFETTPSLIELARRAGRDHSVIARNLRRISEKFPVVEKKAGKWVLTETGRRLNESSRSGLDQQTAILSAHSLLRIGTNREFSARILSPDLGRLQKMFPSVEFSIQSYEQGTEQALLNGWIDLGIDCDRPLDPAIAYKLVTPEPIIVVASKSFAQKNRAALKEGRYWSLPHLLCERLHPDKILQRSENRLHCSLRFNDIASARAACLEGLGWALLPSYAVADEMAASRLVQIDPNRYGTSKYGLWWPRSRKSLAEVSSRLIAWLGEKKL